MTKINWIKMKFLFINAKLKGQTVENTQAHRAYVISNAFLNSYYAEHGGEELAGLLGSMSMDIFAGELPADPAIWSEFTELWDLNTVKHASFIQKAYAAMYSFLQSWWKDTEDPEAKEILARLAVTENGLPAEKIWERWLEVAESIKGKNMYDDNTIVSPLPSQELIAKEEGYWHIKLPNDYKEFIAKYNGVVPLQNEFSINGRKYLIERFLPILENPENNEFGEYDIDVVLTELDERLISDEDLIGIELLPIATLFAGDFLVLDYAKNRENPSLSIWLHDESADLEPITVAAFDTFTQLTENMTK